MRVGWSTPPRTLLGFEWKLLTASCWDPESQTDRLRSSDFDSTPRAAVNRESQIFMQISSAWFKSGTKVNGLIPPWLVRSAVTVDALKDPREVEPIVCTISKVGFFHQGCSSGLKDTCGRAKSVLHGLLVLIFELIQLYFVAPEGAGQNLINGLMWVQSRLEV